MIGSARIWIALGCGIENVLPPLPADGCGIVLCLLCARQVRRRGPGRRANLFDELPVVLSASRLMQPQDEAPGATTLIDQAMIRASGARDLAELLRLIPGFQVASRAGHTPLTTITGSPTTRAAADAAEPSMATHSASSTSSAAWGGTRDLDRPRRHRTDRGLSRLERRRLPEHQRISRVVNIITRAAADTPGRVRDPHRRRWHPRHPRRAAPISVPAALRLSAGANRTTVSPDPPTTARIDRADMRLDWRIAADQQIGSMPAQLRRNLQMGRFDDPSGSSA